MQGHTAGGTRQSQVARQGGPWHGRGHGLLRHDGLCVRKHVVLPSVVTRPLCVVHCTTYRETVSLNTRAHNNTDNGNGNGNDKTHSHIHTHST